MVISIATKKLSWILWRHQTVGLFYPKVNIIIIIFNKYYNITPIGILKPIFIQKKGVHMYPIIKIILSHRLAL